MPDFRPDAARRPEVAGIRSLALVGQTASGKTSLAEALLHRAGVIGTPGSLERGDHGQ
jgi:elongation factor G